MAKFSGKSQKTNQTSVIGVVDPEAPDASTYEGATGWGRDALSDVFLQAVTEMVGEDTYYESAEARGKRFRDNVRKAAKEDPQWMARFIPYLRDTMNMRSASVVATVEAVRALLGTSHGINLRSLVDSAVVRADEPAEIIGYYLQQYGRNLPMPVKRGVADAVRRVYNERSALKYDGQGNAVRMGDVLDLTHPDPKDERQSALFKYILDRRHNREFTEGYDLPIINATREIDNIPVEQRREKLLAGEINFEETAFTWERVSGWINGPMDAPVWEAIIPRMGYMALLRNLRNFEQAGISKESIEYVKAKLTDPEEVRKSRQFPFRFLSAYRAQESLIFAQTIEEALDLSVENVPEFTGRTLVLVDVSGSMQGPLSARSKVSRWDVGALLGAVLGVRSEGVDLVAFGTDSAAVSVPKGASVLKVAEKITETARKGHLGWGTNTYPALQKHFNGHDRVIVVTDMQSHAWQGDSGKLLKEITSKGNIYNINTAGYSVANMPTGSKGIFEFGGFNDQMFKAIKMLEDKQNSGWPF